MECVKCGPTKVMKNIAIKEFGHSNIPHHLSVKVKKTDRILFNSYAKGKILANICGNCGHMELSVLNPKELWEAYSQKKQ